MRVNQFRAIVGAMILVSVALSYFISPYWQYFTVFIGLNLFQSAFTGFCPLDMILKRIGNQGGIQ